MKTVLIVDGYNVIGAWKQPEREKLSIAESRERLLHALEDYAGYTGEEVILVFDGYQSDRLQRSEEKHGNLTLVYTKHAETADSYIERITAQMPKYYEIRVVTSDLLEQSQVFSTGAIRVSSAELLRDLNATRNRGMSQHTAKVRDKYRLEEHLSPETLKALEQLRREE